MTDQEGYQFEVAEFMRWLPVYLILAFAVYVLSTGPFYWLIFESYFLENDSYVAVLYLPLVWLADQSNLFANWIDWYIGLWVL